MATKQKTVLPRTNGLNFTVVLCMEIHHLKFRRKLLKIPVAIREAVMIFLLRYTW